MNLLKGAGIALLSLYMCFALRLDVAPHEIELSLQGALAGLARDALPGALLLTAALAALCVAAMRVSIRGLWSWLCLIVPAGFLTGCTLIGRAFVNPEWGYLVISPRADQLKKCLLCLPGWFMFALLVLIALYGLLDLTAQMPRRETKCALLRAFERRPFLAPLAVLMLCLFPVAVLSWPGIVVPGDTYAQLAQMYGDNPGSCPLIYSDSMLTNHHPILHTALLHAFVEGGRTLLDSGQAGLGLFMCMQVILTACAIAYALSSLYRAGMPAWASLAAALLLGLHPRVQNLIVMVSKDMLYADALLVFLTALVQVLRGARRGGLLLMASAVAVMLLRNEGVYVALATLFLLFVFFREHRKSAAIVGGACAVLWLAWTNIAFPALRISPSSSREMLSIPFQQTGRYVAGFADEVTETERAAIDGVLRYDLIADNYTPDIADGVKGLYRNGAGMAEKAAYAKAWAAMLLKHPMTYIEAVLENKNLWIYPTEMRGGMADTSHPYWVSALDFTAINEDSPRWGFMLAYPEALKAARETYEGVREGIFSLPGLRLMTQNAPLIWAVVVLFCYALHSRKLGTLLLLVPLALQVMVIFVGPMDGEAFRYSYPLLLALPIPLAHMLFVEKHT